MELLPNESPHPRHSHRLVQHTGKRAEGCNDHSLYLQLNRGWPRGVNLSAMLLSVTIECCMRSTDARASSTVRSGRGIRSRCRYESRSAFRREAAVGIDRPVSEANQFGTKGRGEGNCFKSHPTCYTRLHFVDTAANHCCHFVYHVYSLGANDTYKSLKTTLKSRNQSGSLGNPPQRHLAAFRKAVVRPDCGKGDEGVSGVN